MAEKNLKDIEFHTSEDGAAKLILDGRYSPYVFMKFVGAPDVSMVKAYFDFRDRHNDYEQQAHQRAVIVINDITDGTAPPSTVRKMAGEFAAKDVERGIITIMIVTNPLLRGVMTAIVWIAGSDNLKLMYANTLEKGVHMARELFESRGLNPVPEVPPNYNFPKPK
jgi:hypothetical protein